MFQNFIHILLPKISRTKNIFAILEGKLLGHAISKYGVYVDLEIMKAIM